VTLRLLHFADLHLDRSYAKERLHGIAAQQRREDLRAALERVVARARDAQVDLITCGGDLFEQEHVTRDTCAFVQQALGDAGRPVLIAPGHADPAVASSPYRYLRWPANVTVAAHEDLRPYRFGDVQVWSAGFMRPDVPGAALRDFTRLDGGLHLLLLHASDMSHVPQDTAPVKPILDHHVQEAGFRHALLGHYHAASSGEWLTYPGSPEPLGWDDVGRHSTALVTVDDRCQFAQATIDVSGMTTPDNVRQAVIAVRNGTNLNSPVMRATLVGERSPALAIDPHLLSVEWSDGFAYLELRDRTHVSHDLNAMAQEFTSRGELVRKLVDQQHESRPGDQAADRALELALGAFDE